MGRSASSTEPRRDEVAAAYLIWPVAAFALAREDGAESVWARLHVRQALVLGIVLSAAYAIVLALPLIVTILWAGIPPGVVVAVYGFGFLADLLAAAAWLALGAALWRRARRGDLFTLPVVSALADRMLRIER